MKSNIYNKFTLPKETTIFSFNGTPVVARKEFWPIPVLLTGVLTWIAGLRKAERSWPQRLEVALLAMPFALVADIGHALAHTISARFAGAPTDEILLSAEMPRTLYKNNTVPPRIHILRSLGGPIFSLICVIVSYFWRRNSPGGSLNRELADTSLACHSFILLGSIAPFPMVDGGTILKWKLVDTGVSPEQADRSVQKINQGLGIACLATGTFLAFFQNRRWAGGFIAIVGAVSIAAGRKWLK